MFSWPVTFTAAADEVKPHLNFLHHFTSKVVKLNIPRGREGGREERLRVGGWVWGRQRLFQHASAPPTVIL